MHHLSHSCSLPAHLILPASLSFFSTSLRLSGPIHPIDPIEVPSRFRINFTGIDPRERVYRFKGEPRNACSYLGKKDLHGLPSRAARAAAGGFFTYEFYAHPVGTTFYHSPVSTQHEAGLSGLVHVRDPKAAWQQAPESAIDG